MGIRISIYRVALSIGALLCSVALPVVAQAATTVYTDEASFFAALNPVYYSEDFASIAAGQGSPTLTQNGFSYIVSDDNGSDAFGNPDSSPSNIQSNFTSDCLLFTMTGNPDNAIGGYFYDGDFVGNYEDDASETIDLKGIGAYTYTPTSASQFIGFISTSSISQVDVTGAAFSNTSSRFVVGTSNASTPEANSGFLVALVAPALLVSLLISRRSAYPARIHQHDQN